MKLILCVLLLGSAACGKAIDPAFQLYVDHFQEEGKVNANVSIQFGDAGTNYGFCDFRGNITISKAKWDIFSDTMHEYVIYHELGHCALGRLHDLETDDHAVPKSMMFPDSVSDKVYLANRPAYIAELFKGAH